MNNSNDPSLYLNSSAEQLCAIKLSCFENGDRRYGNRVESIPAVAFALQQKTRLTKYYMLKAHSCEFIYVEVYYYSVLIMCERHLIIVVD